MRLFQRLGWICMVFAVVVFIGQARSDEGAFWIRGFGYYSQNVHSALIAFIQFLWLIFFAGAIGMSFDKYWGRWAIALSGLLILVELLNYEVLPLVPHGWTGALQIMLLTWPGVAMGRGPISFVILLSLVSIVILKGLARRPSSSRRGSSGTYLRTRETD